MATPLESEIQDQWKKWVDILEKHRVYADATATAGGEIDVLEQDVEGEYTPGALISALAGFRATLSDPISPSAIRAGLDPIFFEYAARFDNGSGFTDIGSIMRALWEHFHTSSPPTLLASRNITYDTSATTSNSFGGAIVGNGQILRLTVDEQDYRMEACHVERKIFRCVGDQTTGTDKHAETFQMMGDTPPKDALDRPNFGSGLEVFIRSKHAGTGDGGSLLRNSSFTTFAVSASSGEQFTGWVETGTSTLFTKETTITHRGSPGTTTAKDAALQLTGGGGTLTVKQPITKMIISALDPDVPYFFRVMFNRSSGSAGGTLTIKMGSSTKAVTLSGQSGYTELRIDADSDAWPRRFNEDIFDVEISWTSPTGTLYIDDVIFAQWEPIDGTYWCIIGGATAWQLDDNLLLTDTGGAPANAKLQYWLWAAGLGYLPSTTGTETLTDP